MNPILIAIIAILVILILYIVIAYNRLITLRNRIENAWSQIDVQLKRRYDLIPNLVSTVKGYVKHEKEVLTAVTKARTSLMKAKSVEKKAEASNQITDALKSLFAVAESYPDLKANKNFLMLQEELAGTESKIAYARQFYNDNILDFDNSIKVFPGKLFASIFKVKPRPYLKITEAERKVPEVKFD